MAVLLLALPRLQASFRYLPVEHALKNYYETREIPSDRLPVLIRFAEKAVGYRDNYQYHDGLSLLHLLRAMDINTPALERLDAYRTAEIEAITSLRAAPAQPVTWLRLANIRWIVHEEPADILAPWKMSIFTGRKDSTLLAQRLEIGLAFMDYLDEEGVAMLRDQLLLAWRMQAGSIIKVLALRDPNLEVTRPLIATTDPAALAEMEAWLEKLR